MKKRPLIGITMRLEVETGRFYLGRDYSEAIEYFGGIPFLIPLIPKRNYISELIQNLDGVLLPGSDTDVDPYYYSEEPLPKLKRVVPEKDSTDFLVLEEAERLNIPLLAICFGMQALNVFCGGSLYQDIEIQIDKPLKHEQGVPLSRLSHSIEVKSKSKLSSFVKNAKLADTVKVNSHHHQSVKQIGESLVETAWTKDGVIECIEGVDKDRFVFGTQWHPEISFEKDVLSREIFSAFIKNCENYSNKKRKLK